MLFRTNAYGAFDDEVIDWRLKQPGNPVTPFHHCYGAEFYEHLRKDPAGEEAFSKAMTGFDVLGKSLTPSSSVVF